MNTPYIDEEFI